MEGHGRTRRGLRHAHTATRRHYKSMTRTWLTKCDSGEDNARESSERAFCPSGWRRSTKAVASSRGVWLPFIRKVLPTLVPLWVARRVRRS